MKPVIRPEWLSGLGRHSTPTYRFRKADHSLQSPKVHLAVRLYQCASLAKEIEASALTSQRKAILAQRWDHTLKEAYVLQLMLDLLERQEKVDRDDGA